MGDRTGALLIVAALILGASIVAGSLLIQSSMNEAASQLSGLRTAVSNLELAVPSAPAPQQAAAQPGRPDPSRRYTVNTNGAPARGPEDAKVAIIEFSDFQCPFCARVSPTLEKIEEEYGDKVRIVFKHLPLRIHPKAPDAHAAAEAAHRQGKFWEMHDKIFGNQREMAPEKYVEWAGELGLDVDRFKSDAASAEVKARVEADASEAQQLGVTGTPGFFINGRFLSGARPFESFKEVIDEELGQG